jgi:hypothetical protein
VDNDGMHGTETRGGWYTFLAPGQYDFAVSFFEQGGDQVLRVYWGSEDADIPMHTSIPDAAFGAAPPPAASALTYKYYEGSWTHLPDFSTLTALASGTVNNITLAPRKRNEQFAMLFQGKITIPKAGRYYFETASDDGSKLYIGGYGHSLTPVVDNDGQHGTETRGGWYTFPAAGQYDFAVSFFEQGGDEVLRVYWGSEDAGIPMHTTIPDAAFGGAATPCGTYTLTASEGDSYRWSTGETTRSIQVMQGGSYTVQVTRGGCAATSEPAVITCTDNIITQSGETLKGSVQPEAIRSAGKLTAKVLPNPSATHFTLQVGTSQNREQITLYILDGVGRLVETKIIAAGTSVQVGNNYVPGTYFVQVVQGSEKVTLKLVKTGAF